MLREVLSSEIALSPMLIWLRFWKVNSSIKRNRASLCWSYSWKYVKEWLNVIKIFLQFFETSVSMTSCISPYPSSFHFCFSFWRKTLWLTGFTSRCWSRRYWNISSDWISLHGRRRSYRETGEIWRWKVSERASDIHIKNSQGYIALILHMIFIMICCSFYLKNKSDTIVLQVEGGCTLSVRINWSQRIPYVDDLFCLSVPFSFPAYLVPPGKKSKNSQKILLHINSGISSEVVCKHTSHPMKVIQTFH